MLISHDVGKTITCFHIGQRNSSWTLDYMTAPKPFMHPVQTPAGHLLSLLEPADHLWHRGLWFSFKFVNGDNFWEERPPFGTQRVVGIPEIIHASPEDVELRLALDWIPPKGDERIIAERRTIRSCAIDDTFVIDWESVLTAGRDITLDRTPYTTWGGYGGLSFRGSRSWLVDRFLLPNGVADSRPAGQTGAWCEMSGPLDGGANLSAGLAMLDHPDNPRYPTPWYGGGAGSGNFLNSALLFHEPMKLQKGEMLALRYRVLIHGGIWDAERLRAEHQRWLEDK